MEKKNRIKKMLRRPMLNSSHLRSAQLQRGEGRVLGVAIWIGGKKIRESFGSNVDSLFLFQEDGKLVLVGCLGVDEGDPESWKIAVQRNKDKLLGAAVWIPARMLEKVLDKTFGNAKALTFATKGRDNGLVLQPRTEEVREEG